MDVIRVQGDPDRPELIQLAHASGKQASILQHPEPSPGKSEEIGWRSRLYQAASELGLSAGQRVVISMTDPALHTIPWEHLGGALAKVSVVRLIQGADIRGSSQAPRPLRVLVALPEGLSIHLRAALDSLQRQDRLGLTLVDLAHLGRYLGQTGYYHAVHIPGDAAYLASAAKMGRQFGKGGVPLLVIHEGKSTLFPALHKSGLRATLLLHTPFDERQSSRFLAELYANLTSGAALDLAVTSARGHLPRGDRSKVLLFSSQPEGNIWPVAAPPRTRDQPQQEATPPVRPEASAPGAASGLFVGGNVNVGGDVVTGTKHQTIQQVGGDMVAINRQAPATKEHRPAGRFCPACGTRVEANHAFCQKCGQPLHGGSSGGAGI